MHEWIAHTISQQVSMTGIRLQFQGCPGWRIHFPASMECDRGQKILLYCISQYALACAWQKHRVCDFDARSLLLGKNISQINAKLIDAMCFYHSKITSTDVYRPFSVSILLPRNDCTENQPTTVLRLLQSIENWHHPILSFLTFMIYFQNSRIISVFPVFPGHKIHIQFPAFPVAVNLF